MRSKIFSTFNYTRRAILRKQNIFVNYDENRLISESGLRNLGFNMAIFQLLLTRLLFTGYDNSILNSLMSLMRAS